MLVMCLVASKATIDVHDETLAQVTFENVQLNVGQCSAYDADGNLVIRLK